MFGITFHSDLLPVHVGCFLGDARLVVYPDEAII